MKKREEMFEMAIQRLRLIALRVHDKWTIDWLLMGVVNEHVGQDVSQNLNMRPNFHKCEVLRWFLEE